MGSQWRMSRRKQQPSRGLSSPSKQSPPPLAEALIQVGKFSCLSIQWRIHMFNIVVSSFKPSTRDGAVPCSSVQNRLTACREPARWKAVAVIL